MIYDLLQIDEKYQRVCRLENFYTLSDVFMI